jgi:hypothetical protein
VLKGSRQKIGLGCAPVPGKPSFIQSISSQVPVALTLTLDATLLRLLDPNHFANAIMSRFEGQIPGGVLKSVVEEHRFMDEFIQLLKRR